MGWIGGSYTKDFKTRGYDPISYSMEEPYVQNKERIAECDIVFIAVPTPTTENGFDYSILPKVLPLVGKGKTVVIKSTVLPGTTKKLQDQFPDIYVMHSPEFLSEATAVEDAAHPKRNIIGIPVDNPDYRSRAEAVMAILPESPYNLICGSTEAEIIKYQRNVLGYVRIVMHNLLWEVANAEGADWNTIKDAISHDPDNGPLYTSPVHKSGRGAGGHCFVKDYAAFVEIYSKLITDPRGIAMLNAIKDKNLELLAKTDKDKVIVEETYGEGVFENYR